MVQSTCYSIMKTSVQVPALRDAQTPLSPAPRHPTPSSALHGYPHSCVFTLT